MKFQDSTSKPHYFIFNYKACSTRNLLSVKHAFFCCSFISFWSVEREEMSFTSTWGKIVTLWTDWVFHKNKMNNRNRMHNWFNGIMKLSNWNKPRRTYFWTQIYLRWSNQNAEIEFICRFVIRGLWSVEVKTLRCFWGYINTIPKYIEG